MEIVKATLPRKRRGGGNKGGSGSATASSSKVVGGVGGGGGERGVHCTATWVGPTNPSGRRRREGVIHRTRTVDIDNSGGGDLSDNDCGGTTDWSAYFDEDDDELNCTENVFTVDDDSFFLVETSMRQLVNASGWSSHHRGAMTTTSSKGGSSDGGENRDNGKGDGNDGGGKERQYHMGGLRIDVYERSLDVLNSMYSTVMADNVADRERNALTRDKKKSATDGSGLRLLGSVFLTPEEILSRCDGGRFECHLMENVKKLHHYTCNGGFFREGGGATTTAAVAHHRASARRRRRGRSTGGRDSHCG